MIGNGCSIRSFDLEIVPDILEVLINRRAKLKVFANPTVHGLERSVSSSLLLESNHFNTYVGSAGAFTLKVAVILLDKGVYE